MFKNTYNVFLFVYIFLQWFQRKKMYTNKLYDAMVFSFSTTECFVCVCFACITEMNFFFWFLTIILIDSWCMRMMTILIIDKNHYYYYYYCLRGWLSIKITHTAAHDQYFLFCAINDHQNIYYHNLYCLFVCFSFIWSIFWW